VLGNYVLILGAVGSANRVRARAHQDIVHLIGQIIYFDHRVLMGCRRQWSLNTSNTLAVLLADQLLGKALNVG